MATDLLAVGEPLSAGEMLHPEGRQVEAGSRGAGSWRIHLKMKDSGPFE